jgi:amino acid adenylation domain-containing protein
MTNAIPPPPPPIQHQSAKQTRLSFSQESLWFLQQLDPENTAYNSNYLLRFTGRIDPACLERALNELVHRHEPLRTVYPNQGGSPVQVIQPFKPFTLPFVDFSGLPEDEQQQAILKYASEKSDQPFNLQRGPLVRYALLHQVRNVDTLFFCTHHINSDAWSQEIFIKELMQFYKAFQSGKEANLSELPIQYADYAAWQREWLSGETLEVYIDHWKKVLAGDLPVLELPTDRPRPVVQTFRGARYYFQLPPGTSSRMKEFCRRERMTPFQVLLAAYALLLMRYTGQEDIIIGCPFANRSRPELENLVGLFVNTLPIRVNLQGNPGVREFLNRVRSVMLEAYPWQTAPFEALVSGISPQRDLSRTPIFQVVINLRNVPKRQTSLEELEMEKSLRENDSSQFDLALEFDVDEGGELVASLRYNVDLFDESTIMRMATHYQNLLGELLMKTGSPIAELVMLAPSERQRIVGDWTETVADYPREKCIHQLFEEQVERTPDKVALVFEDQQLTYRELNARANQLAHYLRSLGVGPDVLVGICLERSLEMVIGLLGILKAGGAYVPLDPSYPPERKAFMLEDSRSPVLVTQLRHAEHLPGLFSQVIRLDADGDLLARQSENNLPINIKPDNLAYTIYTSGSTGKPKGVLVSHYNVVRLFQATQTWFRFDDQDVWTLFHSFAFDFSVWEIWGALLHGGQLIVVPYFVSRTPEAFYNLLIRARVTVLNQTPSAFHQLIQADENAGKNELNLRWIIFGGEVLDFQSLRPWFDRHGDERPILVNMYGITETTVHVTYRPISQRNLAAKGVSAIGIPIPDLQVYLLDTHRQVVPIGVPGEIYVGGAGVARGYLNRPDLTAEKFIQNPFSVEPGARLYKSGDLARWRPGRQLEFLGRQDTQVKVRGYRIELGEIEATIEQYPEIQKAVVLLREDQPKDKRLAGYFVLASGETLDVNKLRSFLQERLPDYMIPSAFVQMDAFPLNINGKIDRRALPTPEAGVVTDRYLAPRDDIEKRLVSIWEEILGIERVGVRDNFFELGGHSLLAVRLITRIQEEFGQFLPLMLLFEDGTIEAMADSLTPQQKTSSHNDQDVEHD